jgi:hypothetical protein
MLSTRTWLTGAALAVVAFAGGPAAAQQQGWWNTPPGPGWREPGWHGYPPQHGYGYYGPGNGYGYGWSPDADYGVDTGVMDVAVCPPGYHLGRRPGLCWPD